ncbi:MAG TPA: glycosyltransferase family 4 protein [Anaerolineae bacterium]|nr:glycosyltransferase family 4 protein [Anaerolineae bacterium]
MFAQKLVREFENQGISSTFRQLRSAQTALLFSVSWGNWFHRLCRSWRVRTVLRVDGFSVPAYFDNRPQQKDYQDRRLKLEDMAQNYRLQRDLLMSDFIIYQSVFSKHLADQYLYRRQDGFAVIHNGVDLQHFHPGLPRRGRLRLLSLGVLRDEYMLGTVLPVFAHLWQRFDLELHVVGSLAPICWRQIEAFRQNYPEASDRIQVVDSVNNDDLPRYIQQSDLLVHPRLGDSCPNVVIEAMACGVPVVCGSWGGTSELVGEGGVVVPTGQWTYGEKFISDLCGAATIILENLDSYKSKARQRAEQAFDIQNVAREYARSMGI